MNGILYGVSVGSGDPGLITLKAVRIINSCDIIAVPRTKGENTLALDIVRKVCCTDEKEILYLDFLMTRDTNLLERRHRELAEELFPYLKSGKNIAFISIGDISVYSTFSYISDIVEKLGFDVEICAGVTSFCAVSARLKRPLVLGNNPLIIMPSSCDDFESLSQYNCTRVIMKSGKNISELREKLDGNIFTAENCGLSDEKIYNGIPEKSGYFTTIIAESKNKYIYHGKEKLRCGYTTGTCSAIASKASAEMLVTGKEIHSVKIMTPKGIEVSAEILDIDINDNYVSCAVKKYSGDDPDITDGILIYAKAEKIKSGIEITGGEGIGIVTAKGLDQPCGEYAINSVPRKMIAYEVGEILEYYSCDFGIKITISAPQGTEIAEKTYNPRIGIKGGISIIGTSGIVEPMSSKALIDTFRLEMRSRRANGIKNLLLAIGNYSENFLNEKIPDLSEKAVKCSNFIGEAIDSALEYKFQSILIVGHIGKLVKLGAGIMNTHSSQADGRFEVLVTCGVIAGADSGILKKIPECVTTDEAIEIFSNAGILDKVSEILMKKIQYHLNAKVKNSIPIGAILFSNKYGIIGMTENAEKIAEEYYG